MSRIEQLFRWVYLRIEANTRLTTEQTVLARLLVGSGILWFHLCYASHLAGLPDGLFQPSPYSFTALLRGFPGVEFFLFWEVVQIIALAAIVLGLRARWAGWAFCLAYVILSSFKYSLGKIDHSIFVVLVIFCLSLTNWGCRAALLPDRRWKFPRLGPALLAILLCWGMFTAGLPKLAYWVDFDLDTSGFLSWFNAAYFNQGKSIPLADLVLALPPWVLEGMDYAATAFELLAFPALLLGRRSWLGWLTVAVVFHAANVLLLAIDFRLHIWVYLPFILGGFAISSRQLAGWHVCLGTLAIMVASSMIYARFTFDLADYGNPYRVFGWPLWAVLSLWSLTLVAALYAIRQTGRNDL